MKVDINIRLLKYRKIQYELICEYHPEIEKLIQEQYICFSHESFDVDSQFICLQIVADLKLCLNVLSSLKAVAEALYDGIEITASLDQSFTTFQEFQIYVELMNTYFEFIIEYDSEMLFYTTVEELLVPFIKFCIESYMQNTIFEVEP